MRSDHDDNRAIVTGLDESSNYALHSLQAFENHTVPLDTSVSTHQTITSRQSHLCLPDDIRLADSVTAVSSKPVPTPNPIRRCNLECIFPGHSGLELCPFLFYTDRHLVNLDSKCVWIVLSVNKL